MPKSYQREQPQISVSKGEAFVIELAANPTTGYEWQPDFDPAVLKLAGRELVRPGSAVGEGGVEHFRFESLAAGATRLSFAYRRGWEPAVKDQAVFEVTAD
ncbi:protease inhibitor I42 family protein [Malikia sp.]|uniref:protease inhibitor I42 family protein n=1 Tax=Malikia sp. TaxID=2070706 RepID=UPI0026342CDB|nr:protease inhibitor I42 family protein [Malikia sp.]MDD2729918.1 protease inhibitor I42 family protein [Malikia sp.]